MRVKFWRWVELAAGFIVLPIAVGRWVNPAWWVPALWAVAAAAWAVLWRDAGVRPHGFWARVEWATARPHVRSVAWRFAGAAVAMVAGLLWLAPDRFLSLPVEQPLFWLAVMLLYPVLSVYPQELLYRRYFFHRFAGILPHAALRVLASALTFGWMHLIFRNEIAVAFTMVGGWLFADTYRRSGSLRLACLEHALYGNFVFTVGLGDFFYHGAVGA